MFSKLEQLFKFGPWERNKIEKEANICKSIIYKSNNYFSHMNPQCLGVLAQAQASQIPACMREWVLKHTPFWGATSNHWLLRDRESVFFRDGALRGWACSSKWSYTDHTQAALNEFSEAKTNKKTKIRKHEVMKEKKWWVRNRIGEKEREGGFHQNTLYACIEFSIDKKRKSKWLSLANC